MKQKKKRRKKEKKQRKKEITDEPTMDRSIARSIFGIWQSISVQKNEKTPNGKTTKR